MGKYFQILHRIINIRHPITLTQLLIDSMCIGMRQMPMMQTWFKTKKNCSVKMRTSQINTCNLIKACRARAMAAVKRVEAYRHIAQRARCLGLSVTQAKLTSSLINARTDSSLKEAKGSLAVTSATWIKPRTRSVKCKLKSTVSHITWASRFLAQLLPTNKTFFPLYVSN